MAVHSKNIRIDLFRATFTVATADSWEEAINKFKLNLAPGDTNSHALTVPNGLIGMKSPYHMIVFIDTSFGTIVHESLHMVNQLLYERGHVITIGTDGKIFDEPHAYMLEYVVDKIIDFVHSDK
jgi:hypothetical protein